MEVTFSNLSAALAVALMLSQTASAQLRITEVMPRSSTGTASTLNGDWWELTNIGSQSINLQGYQWANTVDALPSNTSTFFPNFVLNAGQSLIILEGDADDHAAWRSMWGISPSVAILGEDEMVDNNPPDGFAFSGLANGDTVFFYDPAGVLQDSYSYSSSAFVRGTTFEVDGAGIDLGLSVIGENGAIQAANGDIGSPGMAIVPEPTSLTLLALAGGLVLCPRRAKIS